MNIPFIFHAVGVIRVRLALAVAGGLGWATGHAQTAPVPSYTYTTFAGKIDDQGTADGNAATARFAYPEGVAVDAGGNVYVADTVNSTIRKITPAGVVSTVAGRALTPGSVDGVGGAARFRQPHGIAVDGAGVLYVADTSSSSVRRITQDGTVTTVASGVRNPYGIAVDATGMIYVISGGAVVKITPAGLASVFAGSLNAFGYFDGTGREALFMSPVGIAVDATGTLFVTDNNAIRRISAAGVVTTLAGLPSPTMSAGGNSGNRDGTGSAARFNRPHGIAVDRAGVLWVTDRGNGTIRRVTMAGVVTTVGGQAPPSTSLDGVGAAARFSDAAGIAVDAAGALYIADADSNAIRKGTPSGVGGDVGGTGGGGAANPGRLINLSVLTSLAGASDSFSLGYVVSGASATSAKPLVIRAAGPSLGALGVGGTLDDPKIELFAGAAKTGENDNWGGTAAISTAMASVGAFAYSGPTSRDAAVAANITTRDNSVRVAAGAAAASGSGTVIAEVYDATPAANFTATTPRLINVSVLKSLGTGLTAGFVIGGGSAKTILVRAVGPGLAVFGVGGSVEDPKLELFDGASKSVGSNDNWGGGAGLSAAFTAVGAFDLNSTSKDAALLATLQPGNYSVQVSGVGGTGVALVEVYEVP